MEGGRWKVQVCLLCQEVAPRQSVASFFREETDSQENTETTGAFDAIYNRESWWGEYQRRSASE